MANFDQLKQSVAAVIKTNGAEEITGQIMQDVLLTIINSISGGYMFGGVAQHSGNVGNPDYNVFYLAGSGSYTGYGGAITIEAGCYGVFRYNGTWHQEVVDIGVRLSGSIVQGETRGVTGDVINTALQTLFDNVMDILDTLTFTYNTPSAQQATKAMLDVIMTPTGGASHVFGTLTLASATVAAAGLMSAEDKQKVDRMLTDFRSLSLTDTTAAADQATKIVQTLSATLGENPEVITTFTLLAATASKAGLMSAADKAVLDCLVAMLGYYECSTAAGTAAKVVSASGYSLKSGGCIRIKMNNANTADNATLNINSTGAKALYYDGAQASSTNTWEAGEVLEVYYDGTQYQCASGGGGRAEKVKYDNSQSGLAADNVQEALDEMNDEFTELDGNINGKERTLTSSDFTQGTLNPNNGAEMSASNRLRTGYIKVNSGEYIFVVTNGQKYLVYYYDEQKVYNYSTEWLTTDNNEIPIVNNGYIRVLIAKSNDGAITPSELTADVSIILRGVLDIVEEIENSGKTELPPLSSSNFEQGSVNNDTGVDIDANNRIRTTHQIKVDKGTTLSFLLNGQSFVLDYYSTDGAFLRATEWSSLDSTITFDQSYLIRILVRKQDNSAITPSELQAQITLIADTISILQGEVSTLQGEVSTLQGEFSTLQKELSNSLFLGTLVQKAMTASGLTNSTKRVSMQSCCAVPFVGATLRFTLPEYYFIGIRSGNQASNLSYNDYWFKNGDTYTFRSDVRYFRICFMYSSSLVPPSSDSSIKDLTAETVQGLIDSNDIVIHEPNDISLFERNSACEKYAKAIMRPFVSGASNNYSLTKLPLFLHTSDIHGDAKRFKNFMDYADYLEVDAALISGDMVAYNKSNSKMFIDDIASLHSTADLQCLGNHEAYTSTIQEESEMIASCIQRNSCTVNSNEQYPTYYYKDIAGKNMRIIALNLYSVLGSSEAWSFSQAQCEWLIATLASTPANYGVIVMMHAPEVIPPIDEQYGKFRQAILNYTSTGALAARPLANIIDAFIGKESRMITYTSHSTTISVSADFTSVNPGVEFIAYVNGHLHTDTIGFLPNTTHRQLVLNVCCGISIYGTTYPYLANNSDLPRGGKGATQDSFNLYAIDRSSGTVRVAKIGSHVTGDMIDRNFIVLPYKD